MSLADVVILVALGRLAVVVRLAVRSLDRRHCVVGGQLPVAALSFSGPGRRPLRASTRQYLNR